MKGDGDHVKRYVQEKGISMCNSCEKKIQYEEELVAFVKLPKERSILVGPFDVCLAKTAQEIYCKACYDKKA